MSRRDQARHVGFGPQSPLDRLLAELAAGDGVPALARWARRLLDGEAAQSGTAEPAEPHVASVAHGGGRER